MFSRNGLVCLSVATLLTAAIPLAHAAPLGLSLGAPLVFADTISINYTFNSGAGTGTFIANGGIARTIDGIPNSIPNGSFTLIANLQVTGTGAAQKVTPVTGSLSVTGSGHQYFMSSSFIGFGFTTDSLMSNTSSLQTFEFTFQPIRGELAGNGPAGVVLTGLVSPTYTINNALFTNNFNNTGLDPATSRTARLADTTAVPVPSALWPGLGLLSAMALFVRRRKA